MKWLLIWLLLPAKGMAEVPQGAPNASFEPAFADQTRAPQLPKTTIVVTPFATGLAHPWGIAHLPSGQFLVTERPGRLQLLGPSGERLGQIRGIGPVDGRRQGGLLDVAVSPSFQQDRLVFWTYAKRVADGTVTAAARGVLREDGQLIDVEDIFVQSPPSQHPMHFGSRIIPMADGTLWITTGEHSVAQDAVKAQDNATTYGKVIRLNWDGSVPRSNPFVGRSGEDSIWSFGHRNIQGATVGLEGLWTVEHGPAGGDELNRPLAGRNYGWPVISYGVNYDGQPVGSGDAVRDGMEQPVYYWDPVIAPGGMALYEGGYAPWRGDLLIASLNPGGLVRLKLQDGRVIGEERLLPNVGRVRDVEVLPDGNLLILVDARRGGVMHVRLVN